MWCYSQSTGILKGHSFEFQCYSGHGNGRNNPALEAEASLGPIPRGQWRMTGVESGGPTGPYTIILEPVDHDAHGRSLFRIHGDNVAHDASHGCIIHSPLADRKLIYALDHDLLVTS